MSKLYLFGIGGTGSRVIKALTMLLASGVDCKVDTIIPIIIDPDESAGDLTRTVQLMRNYSNVRKMLNYTANSTNKFFKTDISELIPNFRLPVQNTRDANFRDFISVDTMGESNKALVSLLFSENNLKSNMKVGFKGNPNIGSVVLNQFGESIEFANFANDFSEGDKIFIISSIFGGTGASGFPLLLKTLRESKKIPQFTYINEAEIGAITILPYFSVKKDDESEIDSGTFISKTKSALSYYYDNISQGVNKSINALYYLGDDINGSYENCEGGVLQKNNAHFIELVAALSVLDFASSDVKDKIVHKEFGMANDAKQVIFSDFYNREQEMIKKPLTQFLLFTKYMREECKKQYKIQGWGKKIKFDDTFYNSTFITDLTVIQKGFLEWLEEMVSNERCFAPYEQLDTNKIFDIVRGVTPKKSLLPFFSKDNYSLFEHVLNDQTFDNGWNKEQMFIEIFYKATAALVKNKLDFK